jgi:hypothetical protein
MTDVATQANTRVKTLLEAIDAFVLAAVVLQLAETNGASKRERERCANDHEEALGGLETALHGFTLPLVRLVQGPQEQEAQGDDRVKCDICAATAPCKANCRNWAACIRSNIAGDSDIAGNCDFCGEPPVADGERCPHKDCPHDRPSYA